MEIKEPGSHIDHMLRQTRMHHMQLSSMSDMKANMLLTVASLVLGLALSHLSKAPDQLVFLVLALASVLTIALAIYATMPKAGPKSFRKVQPDIASQHFTLLFFGDYTNLSYPEFAKGMEDVMNNHSLNYEAQVRELYNLGCYLAKHKFHVLRFAYLSFLIGVMLSGVIACWQYL